MKKDSGRGRSPSPSAVPEAQSKAPAGRRKAKASPRKLTSNAVKKTDKRGTPKGNATRPGGRGGKIGNPAFKPTDEDRIRIEAMVACGTKQPLIADIMGFSTDTLQRHFAKELALGKELALAKIGGSYVRKALEGDPEASKYVLARLAGWKQTTSVENSGPNGGPIVISAEPPRRDLSMFTEEELQLWEQLTAKAEAGNVAVGDE